MEKSEPPKSGPTVKELIEATVDARTRPMVQELIEGTVSAQDFMEAMKDPKKAQALMELHSWTREDLYKRADLVSKMIATGLTNVNLKLKMCC